MATIINGDGIVTAEGTSTTQGRLRLGEDTDNGTNYVELQAPASVASNVTFTLPSADGTSGQVIQTNGSGALSFTTPAAPNFQEFTATGTWTKPSGATFVMVEAWGAGGGGASGRRGAASSFRGGGSAGGGGAYRYKLFKASDLGATVTVTIGAGGTGGAAITVNDTNGNVGVDGGNSSFGTHLVSYGGQGAVEGGTTSTANGGSGGGSLSVGGGSVGGAPYQAASSIRAQGFGGGQGQNGASATQTSASTWGQASGFGGGGGSVGLSSEENANSAGGSSAYGGGGGGSGGHITDGNTTYAGTAGGSQTGTGGGGGAGGSTQGAAGTAGTSNFFGGGGGGWGNSAAAGAGGAGGIAGGGGGGGGSTNGNNSGAGGAGGAGLVRVYTW